MVVIYNTIKLEEGSNMNKSMIVTQGYELVNGKYKLSSSELKFILIVISQIDSKQDDDLDEYIIKLSELEDKLQSKQNETHLKQFAKKLMSKPLEVNLEGGGFEIYNWFSKVRYKDGLFTVRIDKDLKPYLLQLKKRFVKYNLKYVLQFESQYSIRIYQFLKEYEKLKKRYFDVEELQDLLQVPKSYRRYDNFKRKVLEVAEKEINEHTDLFITFEEEKKGRKVVRLIFRIFTKVQNDKNNDKHDFSKYLKTKIYINNDWQTIVKIVADQENDKYIYVDVVDEKFDLTTHHLHITQLQNMIEYSKSKDKK